VERSSRYVVLVHLPHGRTAEDVRAALTRQVTKLPSELRRTLTWDQGKEMADHVRFSVDTRMKVFFCNLTARGSVAATKTPTASCANTSPARPT
jgi:IS30 family transposase